MLINCVLLSLKRKINKGMKNIISMENKVLFNMLMVT